MTAIITRHRHWSAAFLAASFLGASFLPTIGTAKAEEEFDPASLRLDQVQVIGSHNSYHAGVEPGILAEIGRTAPDLARLLDYAHPPLATQLDHGVRQLELDIYADSRGGRFATPHRPGHPDEKWPLPPAEAAIMRQPGFKVMHIPDIDQHASCQPLKACLQEIRTWSHRHPDHVPVFVILEIEQTNDVPGATPVELFTSGTFDALDDTIRSVFKPDELLTPDDVRGRDAVLSTVITTRGWPTLAQSRGKIVFLLDQRDNGPLYLKGHPSLRGRVAFTNAAPDAPDAAFTELNDGPVDQITTLVRRHLIVRTRADVNTVEARDGAIARRDAMLASGAQIVSTDYPDGEPARWSGYRVGFPAGGAVRCNPVTGPAGCIARLIEPAGRHALHLRRVVMVMRHGIRSPLSGQVPVGVTIPGGWPQWEVAPGDLTPRGAVAMGVIGQFERAWLDENGLVPARGCPAPQTLAIRSNSEPRTIASAEAFAKGFAPACPIAITHLPPGKGDPLFSALETDPARFDMRAIVPRLPVADRILDGQTDVPAALAQIVRCKTGACDFLTAANRVAPDDSNHGLSLSGPIREASSIAEALMLAYLDGKPEISAGGKPVDVRLLGTLSALHAAMLNSTVRPPAIAEPISRDLRKRLVVDVTERAGPDFRLYVGHDDTIAPLWGMMDIHIRAPGYAPDEIPVGSALGFAIYGDDLGQSFIRVFFQSQTPESVRTNPARALPSLSFPIVPTCKAATGLCTPGELTSMLQAVPTQGDRPAHTGKK